MARKRMVMEMGMGTDLHGQDYTKASIRALRDALWHNSLTVAKAFGVSRDLMEVEVIVGVAKPELVNCDEVAAVLPYGSSTVKAVRGGLDIPNEDGSSITVIANATAVVYLDLIED